MKKVFHLFGHTILIATAKSESKRWGQTSKDFVTQNHFAIQTKHNLSEKFVYLNILILRWQIAIWKTGGSKILKNL